MKNQMEIPCLCPVISFFSITLGRTRRAKIFLVSSPMTRRNAVALAAAAALSCKREKKRIIGVVPQGRTHLFWQSIHAGAIAAAREAGVEIAWNAPLNETDYNGQIQIVESMINRRLDAIALSPIDRKSMVGVVERAMAQGIPVIIFDTGVETDNFTCRIATDNFGAGKMAAERVGTILNGKGRVAIVATQPGAASTLAREAGFEEKLRQDFPGIKIVDKRFGMSDFAKSLAVAENMLTAYPDLDAMFASNETSSVGAAQALKARRSKVKLVGFDFSPTLIEDLRSGVIDALVAQHPFKMGYESVMAAVQKLNGGSPPKIQDLAALLVTKDNVDEPAVQAQINPDLKKYLP
jgi:ribose transport system substrate-binding protein